jgi:hypothetical protein
MTEIAPAAAGTAEARALQVHFLDGQPLLFDEQRQKLYAADRTAAFVLCCLQDGLDLGAIERKLAAAASLNLAAARRVLREALAELESAASGSREAATMGGDAHPLSGPPPFSGADARTGGPPAIGTDCRIAIAGVRIELACPERGVARRVLAAFAHLTMADDTPPHLHIDVRATAGGYVVFQDREPVLRVAELEGLTPALKAHLVQQVLARGDYRLAVHAAALARDGRVLLLPGDAGSGKSTLAAALMARGFSLLGDDTVLLEDDLRVRGLPFALAVKAGAWDLLKPHHPALLGLPVDRRPDGRVVRYLRPGVIAADPLAARWMVFPNWDHAPAAGLERLSRVEALQRFLPGCYASARRLQANELAELIAWIEGIDCYTLDSSDLAGAVMLIERLCA